MTVHVYNTSLNNIGKLPIFCAFALSVFLPTKNYFHYFCRFLVSMNLTNIIAAVAIAYGVSVAAASAELSTEERHAVDEIKKAIDFIYNERYEVVEEEEAYFLDSRRDYEDYIEPNPTASKRSLEASDDEVDVDCPLLLGDADARGRPQKSIEHYDSHVLLEM